MKTMPAGMVTGPTHSSMKLMNLNMMNPDSWKGTSSIGNGPDHSSMNPGPSTKKTKKVVCHTSVFPVVGGVPEYDAHHCITGYTVGLILII
jgi:hypothetical protein